MSDSLADLVVSMSADFGDTQSQTDSLASGLHDMGGAAASAAPAIDDLASRVQVLVDAGMTLNEALARLGEETKKAAEEAAAAAVDFSDFGQAFSDEAEQVIARQADLEEAYRRSVSVFAELEQAYQQGAVSSQTLALAADDVNEAFNNLHPNLKKVEEAANDAGGPGGPLDHMASTFLEIAGITLTIEALKKFVEECVEVYAEVERATIALGFMMKSTEQARKTIEDLENIAQQFGVAFLPLLQAEQRMIAFGASADQARKALIASMAAAAYTGTSFERTSSAVERMALSGTVSARQLFQLGVTTKDVADAMGVDVENLTKSFKELSVGTRWDVAIEALQKVKGAGHALAGSTESDMTRVKNAWEFMQKDVGEALAPITHLIADFAQKSIAGLGYVVTAAVGFGREMVGVAKLVKDAAAGDIEAARQDVLNLGKAWTETTDKLNKIVAPFANARAKAEETTRAYNESQAAVRALAAGNQEEAESHMKAAMEADLHARMLGQATAAENKHNDALKGTVKAELDAAAAKGSRYRAQQIEIDGEAAHQKALLELKRQGYEADEKLGRISAEQNLPRLKALNDEELRITENAINQKLALEKKAKTEEEKDLTLGSQLQAARDKNASEDLKLTLKTEEEKEKIYDKGVKDHVALLNKELEEDRKVADHVLKLNMDMQADREKAEAAETTSEAQHQLRLLDIQRQAADQLFAAHQITGEKKLAIDRSVEAQSLAIERKMVEDEIAQLDRRERAETDYASKRQALQAKLKALEDKEMGRASTEGIKTMDEAFKTLGVTSTKVYENEAADAEKAMAKLLEMHEPLAVIEAAEEKLLQTEIKLAEARGRSTAAYQIQLTALQEKQKALVSDAEGPLARAYQGFFNVVRTGTSALQNGIVQTIMHTKDLGKTWIDVGKQIGTSILNDILGAGIKQLENALIKLVAQWGINAAAEKTAAAAGAAAQQAATATADVADVTSTAGVAAAKAYAAYVGIPFIGPALAAAAAAEAEAAVLAFLPQAAAEGGADLLGKPSLIMQTHPDEMVLPAEQAATIRQLPQMMNQLASLPAGGGQVMNFDGMFKGANIYGVPTQSFMNAFGEQMIRMLRSAGTWNPKF